MAILLQFDYNKKLGLPGFSSHSFGISMKAEVANLDDVQGEVEKAYSLLQSAVDSQIVNPGFVPSGNGKAIQVQPNGNETGPNSWNCSIRQRSLIVSVLERNGLELDAVDDLAEELHGKPMADLQRLEVSGVITEVLNRWGRKKSTANGRSGR